MTDTRTALFLACFALALLMLHHALLGTFDTATRPGDADKGIRKKLHREGPMVASDVRTLMAANHTATFAELEPARTIWDDLADCESGDRHNGRPIEGTARWDYGLTFDHGDTFRGGLNWTRSTWNAVRADAPADPAQATRLQEIAAAERLMALPWGGWQHWPTCSRMLSLVD